MGYLTTITFYNDDLGDFEKNKLKLAEDVISAMQDNGRQYTRRNGMVVQRPMHSSDRAVFVQGGNTVNQINVWSENTKQLMKDHPQFFEELIGEMENQVARLRKEQKKNKK